MSRSVLNIILSVSIVLTILTLPAGAVLRIGILPDADSIPLIVAEEECLFDKDIKIVRFHNPIERDSALLAGVIDGAISDVLAAAFAFDNQLPVKITSLTNGRYSLLAAKESDIFEYQDIKGVKVAISANTIIEYTTDRLLQENGLAEREIAKIVIPKIPIRLQMLEVGKIKVACLPEPLASIAELKGARRLGSSEELGEAPGILLFTEKAIKEKEDLIHKFYSQYTRAVELVNANSDNYRELLVTKGGFPEGIRKTFEFPVYSKPVLPGKDTVNQVISWLNKKELLKTDLGYHDLVTDRFIQ